MMVMSMRGGSPGVVHAPALTVQQLYIESVELKSVFRVTCHPVCCQFSREMAFCETGLLVPPRFCRSMSTCTISMSWNGLVSECTASSLGHNQMTVSAPYAADLAHPSMCHCLVSQKFPVLL